MREYPPFQLAGSNEVVTTLPMVAFEWSSAENGRTTCKTPSFRRSSGVRRHTGVLRNGTLMRIRRSMAISVAALVGIALAFGVMRQFLRHDVPHDKVAQITEGMQREEVVVLLGNHHGGLPPFMSPYSPDTYACSWEYDNGTVVVWFDPRTNQVHHTGVFGSAKSSLFEKLRDSLMSWF